MRRLIGLVLVAGCASAGAPPGGQERHTPPDIIAVTPDSGAVNVKVKDVEFRFDEVVSDRPSGTATNLDQLFLVSPRNGPPNVSWHRSRITVRPKNGFRANTAYRITMLPGLIDLRGNVLKQAYTVIFSTGATFPDLGITGVVFDWASQRPANGAYIEAAAHPDTSIVYVTATDSSGHFDLGPLPSGNYTVRALMDVNSNRVLDRNEKWDTLFVPVPPDHRPVIELDAIERDSLPPVFENVSLTDSVTLRLTFNEPLNPAIPLQPALIRIQRADSSELEVTKVQWESAFQQARRALATDSARRADSTRRAADTTRAAPAPVPPAGAVQPPAGARQPPPQPKPKSPPPERSIVVSVSPTTPLLPTKTYVVSARGLRNLVGHSRDITRTFTAPKPAPPDTTKKKPPADSTRRPPADSTRRPPAARPPP